MEQGPAILGIITTVYKPSRRHIIFLTEAGADGR